MLRTSKTFAAGSIDGPNDFSVVMMLTVVMVHGCNVPAH
jgi:hypothetical protein